jgi:hypothetical protein
VVFPQCFTSAGIFLETFFLKLGWYTTIESGRNFGKEQDAFSANPFLRMPFLPFRAALFENAFCYTQPFPYECKEKTL